MSRCCRCCGVPCCKRGSRSTVRGWRRQVIGIEQLPPGVSVLGAVSRTLLRAKQEEAWLNLYPCRFPEIFCLAVAECAAAGTPTITSDLEALSERVIHRRTGVMIPGSIDSQETKRQSYNSLRKQCFSSATLSCEIFMPRMPASLPGNIPSIRLQQPGSSCSRRLSIE